MKKLLLLAAACLATATSAQEVSTPLSFESESGIVVPTQARGFFVTQMYGLDANGDVLVCPFNALPYGGKCKTDNGPSVALMTMAKAVPAGRTFVGFRVVPYGYDRQIEIYYR